MGRGIEIGALHHPFVLPPGARVRYVDRMSAESLVAQYPEVAGANLVKVDIIDDGETLATMPDGSENFVIAAQFIEHCENPVRSIVNMLRVLAPGGFAVITVPDKRHTFDKDRPLTTNEHLLEECLHGTQATRFDHYIEWAIGSEGIRDVGEAERHARALMARSYSIHYHVWDTDSFLRFLLYFKERFKLPFEIFAFEQNGMELMVALRKVPA